MYVNTITGTAKRDTCMGILAEYTLKVEGLFSSVKRANLFYEEEQVSGFGSLLKEQSSPKESVKISFSLYPHSRVCDSAGEAISKFKESLDDMLEQIKSDEHILFWRCYPEVSCNRDFDSLRDAFICQARMVLIKIDKD